MITLEIPETGRRIYLPEDLSECDSQQYSEACLLIYKFQNQQLSYQDFRVEMVYKMLNLKKGGGKLVKSAVEDMHSNIYRISQMIDSFFEKNADDKLVIKQYYINNHSQVITDSFRVWHGPSDAFENVSFGEYIDGLNIYGNMKDGVTEDLLYMLMATFYRRKGREYDPSKVQKNARHFRYVYFGRVYGFFLLFASFQQYLTSATVTYQGMDLDLSILFEGGEEAPKSDIPGLGMLSVAHQLAETGVYGDMRGVRKANLWEALLRLYDIRKRDLDNQAEIERQKSKSQS